MPTKPDESRAADTRYPIHELLRQRWSPRAFSEQVVDAATLRSLLEAARWAPSSFNEQPWSFIVGTRDEPEVYNRLVSCLVEFNARWAASAPVLMLSVARVAFERNGQPNRHAFHDVGMAAENLVIQATALGLVVHQMAGFDVEKAREVFGIPQGYEPCAMIALGYLGDRESLPESLRQREEVPRARKPISEFVFGEHWGKTSPLLDPES